MKEQPKNKGYGLDYVSVYRVIALIVSVGVFFLTLAMVINIFFVTLNPILIIIALVVAILNYSLFDFAIRLFQNIGIIAKNVDKVGIDKNDI